MQEESVPLFPSWASRIGVFDLETTGVDVHRDRIVTAHVGIVDSSGAVVAQRNWLADPGVDIPAQATAVHGITTERARRHGHLAAVVVNEVVAELQALFDAGIPVVAYNASFDFSLLRAECERYGVTGLVSPGPIIDPLVIDKAFDRYRKGKRTLIDVAAHYGVSFDNAHDAQSDAVAAGHVALALVRMFSQLLPATAAELHVNQIAWARTQAQSLSDYLVRMGRIAADAPLDGSWPERVLPGR